jgi:hypothetical protein
LSKLAAVMAVEPSAQTAIDEITFGPRVSMRCRGPPTWMRHGVPGRSQIGRLTDREPDDAVVESALRQHVPAEGRGEGRLSRTSDADERRDACVPREDVRADRIGEQTVFDLLHRLESRHEVRREAGDAERTTRPWNALAQEPEKLVQRPRVRGVVAEIGRVQTRKESRGPAGEVFWNRAELSVTKDGNDRPGEQQRVLPLGANVGRADGGGTDHCDDAIGVPDRIAELLC